jgi:sulfate/thiosulfate transport system permease protein
VKSTRALPGFRLGLGWTVTYLALLVVVPLTACVLKASELSFDEFRAAVATPRAIAAYKLTFGTAFAAALVNVVLGLIVAWTLTRYRFPGRVILDALVDVPLALPTAVAGLVYADLYMPDGSVGQFLAPLGIRVSYTTLGIVLVLVFTGFPFVVRTVQPVLEDLDAEVEEAAAVLGAGRWETFRRVILPTLLPPAVTGFALAFARAIGEYGSVVFIATNKPYEQEIAPVLIVAHLDDFQYREAAAVAAMMLTVSFLLLIPITALERWSRRHGG